MKRIHILGASCCGTTTLGRALAQTMAASHLDTDDFFWLPTDPPYRMSRPAPLRLALLRDAMDAAPSWVLSGSMCPWGDSLMPRLDLVVFLTASTELRLARLRAREIARYGEAILAPGGAMHAHHEAFIAWAANYDNGGLDKRSRARHEEWITRLACPVLRLPGDMPTADQLAAIAEVAAAHA
ncbi:MAG: AAA family ATPase [Rhodocyclaceae bacterium]